MRVMRTTVALLLLFSSSASAAQNMDGNDSLRGGERRSVIQRIYKDNGPVRKAVREVEERVERSSTGFNGDPGHKVPYENHPFDKENGRNLQDTTTATAEDLYQNLRITFITTALDNERTSDNAAKIDFIKNEILPRTSEFWSLALAVVPVSGYLKVSASELDNRKYCGDSEFTEVPSEHISTGITDTDLILYVSGTASTRFCSGSTLAVAVACNFDQFDRPIAGSINFCLSEITLGSDGTASESVIQDNVDVAIHEAGHVLGMSSNSYRFFWDSDTGEPRTPRPFSQSTVECVDGQTRSLILPATNTMEFAVASNGQRYATIVTPKVRTVARNQFDCQSVSGGQLENQPSGSDSCTGDHWDERLFYPEALSGVISPTTNILSAITLALMEDTGWYKANYTQCRSSPWGLGAGCDFVTEPCLVPNGDTPTIPDYAKGYFCNQGSQRGCSPELTHKVACTVIDYNYILPLELPEDRFQYFPNTPTRGGPRCVVCVSFSSCHFRSLLTLYFRQVDFCPVMGSTYSGKEAQELDCQNSVNVDSINFYSEAYGSDSLCYDTSTGEGRCFRTACVQDEMVVKVNVRGEWFTCEYDYQELSVRLGAGALPATIYCPRLSSACPDLYCPFNCAGRGVCNFAATVDGVTRPKCECYDSSDTSSSCSDSLPPNGAFLKDSSGLVNNLESNFFDPLVAVFVDHPDKWTTASWAWAAGLLALFMVMLLCICSSFWPSPKKRVSRGRR